MSPKSVKAHPAFFLCYLPGAKASLHVIFLTWRLLLLTIRYSVCRKFNYSCLMSYTKCPVNQITYISQSPDSSLHFCMISESVLRSAKATMEWFSSFHTQSLTASRRLRPSDSPAGSVSSRILLSSALRISDNLI